MPPNPWGGVSDWKRLKEVAGQGYREAILCLASIETVERSNRLGVIKPLQEREADRAARLLIDAVLFRVHIHVVRAFSPVRHGDDLHLRAALGFLRQPDRLFGVQCPEDRADLERAIALFDAAASDARLSSLKHMRDKMLAHWAKPNPDVPSPRYNDLFGFTRKTCEIWERLSFGAGTVRIELSTQIETFRKSADALWSIWEAG